MSDDSLRAMMPSVYQPLLSEVFDRPQIPEPRATCNDCAMCDKGKPGPVTVQYFRPDLKCCTFHPTLPNYLVGAVLADTSGEMAEGRRRLEAKIAGRVGVTPYFLASPRKFNVLAAAARESGFFGRAPSTLCPYFDQAGGGLCTIWRYRESVCSTFFCKYDQGVRGLAFWSALKNYMGMVEFLLARHGATSVEPKVDEPVIDRYHLTIEDLEDRPPQDADYARYWTSQWVGREAEFYVECYKRVKALRRRDFRTIVDDKPQVREKLELLDKRYAEIGSPDLPTHLLRNPKMEEHHVAGQVVVTTYNRLDSFTLDKELHEVLGLLDGNATLEANLARLDSEHGIQLAPELLRALFLQGVLIPPAPPPDKPAEAAADKAKKE